VDDDEVYLDNARQSNEAQLGVVIPGSIYTDTGRQRHTQRHKERQTDTEREIHQCRVRSHNSH